MWWMIAGVGIAQEEPPTEPAPAPACLRGDGPGLRLHRGAYATEDRFDAPNTDPWPGLTPGASSAAWARVTDAVRQGHLPPRGVARAEELLQAIPADDPPPPLGEDWIVRAEAARLPWEDDVAVVRIAVTTRRPRPFDRPPAHLAVVTDARSEIAGGLSTVRASIAALGSALRPDDTLTIVDSARGVVLPPAPVGDGRAIARAADGLVSLDGRHDLPGALAQGYALLSAGAPEGAPARVLLMSDGDLSLIESGEALEKLASDRSAAGVQITTIGYGDLHGRDEGLESLARAAGGTYVHFRGEADAVRLLGDHLSTVIEPVATDLRLVVDWGPAVIGVHRPGNHHERLTGLGPADRSGRELGAGRTAIVVYEVRMAPGSHQASLGTVRVRATPAAGGAPRIEALQLPAVRRPLIEASAELQLAVVASNFAELIGGTRPAERTPDIVALAERTRRPEYEEDAELAEIVKLAAPLIQAPRCR